MGGVACAIVGGAAFAWVRRSREAMTVETRSERRPVGAAQPTVARPR